jgi:cytochrome P450
VPGCQPTDDRDYRPTTVAHDAYLNPEGSFWELSRHADVSAALKDWRTYSSAQGPVRRGELMDMDPPEHDRLRRLLAPRLRAAALAPLENGIRASAHELLDRDAGPEIDLAREFAQPLPVLVMARVLGLSADDTAVVRALAPGLISAGEGPGGAAARMRARSGLAELFRTRVNTRAAGAPGVLEDLGQAVAAGTLELDDVPGLCLMLLVAGSEPTASLLSTIIHALATAEVSAEQLRDARGRVRAAAITELARRHSPVQWVSRVTTRAVPLHATVIPSGARVRLLLGAANREPGRSLAFGLGVHACPGMALAGLQVRVALEVLLERLPVLHLSDPAVATVSPVVRGFDHLPVARPAR